MRRALANDGSNAGAAPGSPSSVGCHLKPSGPIPERTFAIGAKVAAARRYRGVVLEDDEDYADEDPEVVGHAEPAPIERFRRTAIGTTLAAGMFGLRDVLEPPKDETPAIVEDWAGGEPFNDPIVLRLDPDHPEDSIVMVRPWLDPRGPKP
jgi:hypothetical protein